MKCPDFGLLWLTAHTPPAPNDGYEAAREHIHACAACRRLLEIALGRSDYALPHDEEQLTRSILALTGSTHRRGARACQA